MVPFINFSFLVSSHGNVKSTRGVDIANTIQAVIVTKIPQEIFNLTVKLISNSQVI